MQLKNFKKSSTQNGTMDKSSTTGLNCSHQLQIQQIQQLQQLQQQRCSSVGSTGSSTCDTLSSHSGSALSPTLPIVNGYPSKNLPGNATNLATTLSGEKISTSALSLRSSMASRMPLNTSPTDHPSLYPLGAALPALPALPPPAPPQALRSASSGAPSGAQSALNVGVSAAAAMAAANLAESFTLLQQQAAHHFQDILYAAHLLGRGYYQPAGPLISPHVLPPVATGPPPPPSISNVSLLPAATAVGPTSKKPQQQIPAPLGSDPEQIHPAPPSTTSAADSTDSDVLITGGDLTPFRYPASSATGTVPSHHQTSPQHHQQQQQQQQQQQHQLHQQAAAAAAAAAAHQGSPYPRSMHAAQMHYLTAYPPNYYSPYPGEAMCYSPPASAYQPYFSTKVYQSAPPHPPPGAYRRYPYYQPGPPPPPPELYEPSPPPTNSGGSSGSHTPTGQQPTSGSQASQAGPPQQGSTGSQLVPAGQHLDHYPGPPGYYSGYSPGSAAPGQCYTRSIQGPYMEYPPQCPCPMQQSCPKNVHTGPHIGSNSGNSNNHNGSSNINSTTSSSSSNSKTSMNHSTDNNSSVVVNVSQSSTSSSNNCKSTNSATNMNAQTNADSNNSSSSNNNTTNAVNTPITSRGPVKNIITQQVQQSHQQQHQNETTKFVNSYQTRELLKTPVKSELKTEDNDCKSQYEDHVVQPPTPPESYGTNDDKSLLIDDDIIEDEATLTMEKLEMAKSQAPTTQQQQNATITALELSTATTTSTEMPVPSTIEAYDLTTSVTTPSLSAIRETAVCNGSDSNSIDNIGSTLSSSQPQQQPPPPPQPFVGRKARIGKTMAREMVYAAAATAAQPQQQQPQLLQQPLIQVRNLPQENTAASLPTTQATSVTTPIATVAPSLSTATIIELPLLATIKTEIKAEHIKVEDDLMDTILRQQQHINSNSNSCSNHELITELKIKAEPLSSSENELNSSHTAVFNILAQFQSSQEEVVEGEGEQMEMDHRTQEELADSDVRRSKMPKPIVEEKLQLQNGHLPSSPKLNCEIDLSTVSDDEVLDLRQSPVPADSSKRIKILDFQNTPGACKKSSPNSYKSLIKQAEPKAYLSLSRRRMDKRNRYGILQRKTIPNGSVQVRRRHVVLTEEQKERLKVRRRKLIALERKRQELFEKKRAEIRKRKLESIRGENQAKMDQTEQRTDVNVINQIKEPTTTNVKASIKPKKSSVLPMHLFDSNEATIARGYFSEPETTRCSSSTFNCENEIANARVVKSALNNEIDDSRKPKKTKLSSIAEKRSKSETKKPIKSSTNSLYTTFPLFARTDKSTTKGLQDDDTDTPGEVSKSSTKKIGKAKQQQKEIKVKSKFLIQTDRVAKSSKQKTKSKSKQKTASDVAICQTMEPTGTESILPTENLTADQSIPRETNNNEIIEKPIVESSPTTELVILSPTLQTPHDTATSSSSLEELDTTIPQSNSIETAEILSKSPVAVTSHSDRAQVFLQPALPPRILCHSHHFHGKRTRSRAKFGPRKRQKQKHSTVSYELDERPPPAIRLDAIPKWNNGWTWDGQPFQGAVFLNSDDPLVIRTCYTAMRHSEGDIIRTRDCVLLKANEDNELPYVAKVAHLWENPEDGEMMVSLLWYYRPEHTEQGRQFNDSPDEVYASRHRDHNSVACIEDKCYVLTFSEYCRYRRRLRANEEDMEDFSIVPKPASSFYSTRKVPDNTNPELVMFCHRAYEFRSKRLLKMPNKQDYYVVNG